MATSTRRSAAATELIASATDALMWARHDDFGRVAEAVLGDLGEWLGIDRCVVAIRPAAQPVVRVAYTWVRSGRPAPTADHSVVEIQPYAWWWTQLLAEAVIRADDVADLPDEAELSRKFLQAEGVGAIMAVPLVAGGVLNGTLTMEVHGKGTKWTDEQELVARTVANTMWAARTALVSTAELQETVEHLRVANRDLAQANSTLESASRAKDEFLSMASHELRTPLTAVVGFGETLQLHWDDLSDPRRLQALDALMRHALRLDELVTDILRTTRIAADLESPTPRLIQAEDIVRAVVATEDPVFEITGGGTVWADPSHVERALRHLVVNATRYGLAPFAVRIGTASGRTRIAVRDHGPGVPPEFESVLFDRFTQVSTGDRRVSSGTGLGLAIARDLAHLNAGEVTYEPAAPGARFVIDLPAEEPSS